MTNKVERVLPHSQELEQAVLGALLQESSSITEILDILTHEDFYYPSHQIIFDSMVRLHLAGMDFDPMLVIENLRERELLERVGGESYIYALVAAVPDASAIHIHSRAIQRKAFGRKLISLCQQATQDAYNEGETIEEVIGRHADNINRLAAGSQGECFSTLEGSFRAMLDGFSSGVGHDELGEYNTLVSTRGIGSGFTELDRRTGGFHPGELILLGADTRTGKSAFALQVLCQMAQRDIPVGIFSLEMNKAQLAARVLSRLTRINGKKFRTGGFNRDETIRIKKDYEKWLLLPLYIDDTSSQNLHQVRARALQMILRYQVRFIVLDYLELLPRKNEEEEGGYQATQNISRAMKQLAGELGVPVMALRQFTRDISRTSAKQKRRPALWDIRYGGEQDADIALGLYDPDLYNEEISPDADHKIELHILKGRDIQAGGQPIYFTYTRQYHSFIPEIEEEIC